MNIGGKYLSENDLKDCGFKSIGTNVKIHERASIYGVENIRIGSNVRIDDFVVIVATGDLEIGNYVSIHNFCGLYSKNGIRLEDFVTLSAGVKIFTSADDYSGEKMTGVMVPKECCGGANGPVALGKHTIIGAGAVVLPGCNLGNGASVGALSLVKESLDAWGVYAGVPVRRIRERKKAVLELEKDLLKDDKA